MAEKAWEPLRLRLAAAGEALIVVSVWLTVTSMLLVVLSPPGSVMVTRKV